LSIVIALATCLCAFVGCDPVSATKKGDAKAPVQKDEPVDPKAFTEMQFERMKNGLASINVGQMLIQRTHPTGSYLFSNPPQLILSADRHEIIGKVPVKWAGGVTGAQYETDFTIEITKARVRLTTERDTAVFHIEPNQLRLAELDLTNIVRPLQ
jgi:hypothetical protein